MSLRRAKKVGVMTARQFNTVIESFPRLSDTGKEIAQLALVDGQSQANLADIYKIRQQHVSRWVQKVYSKYLETTKPDAGE